MKRLVARQSIFFFLLPVCLAVATPFRSQVITPISAPLQIIVPNGRFLTISNFTQEGNSSPRGTVVVTFATPTPSPLPSTTPTTPSPTCSPSPCPPPPSHTPTPTPTPTPPPPPQT